MSYVSRHKIYLAITMDNKIKKKFEQKIFSKKNDFISSKYIYPVVVDSMNKNIISEKIPVRSCYSKFISPSNNKQYTLKVDELLIHNIRNSNMLILDLAYENNDYLEIEDIDNISDPLNFYQVDKKQSSRAKDYGNHIFSYKSKETSISEFIEDVFKQNYGIKNCKTINYVFRDSTFQTVSINLNNVTSPLAVKIFTEEINNFSSKKSIEFKKNWIDLLLIEKDLYKENQLDLLCSFPNSNVTRRDFIQGCMNCLLYYKQFIAIHYQITQIMFTAKFCPFYPI